MSVKTFLNEMYESGLDLSNDSVEDFIVCVKRLNQILSHDVTKSVRQDRQRKYNSVLSTVLQANDIFDSNKVPRLFRFSENDVQIDVCIRRKFYYVCINGSWRPKIDALKTMFFNENFNFDGFFDFPEIESKISHVGTNTYIGGFDFPVNAKGFKRIRLLFNYCVLLYTSDNSKKIAEVF